MSTHEKLLTADNPVLHQRAKAMRQEMSEAEAKLWQHLRAGRLNGYKFRRQQPMGNYIVDFMCVTPKLIVEADGGQHAEQAVYDHARTAYLNSLGFTVLRFCPRGREKVAADFAVAGGLKGNLDLQLLFQVI